MARVNGGFDDSLCGTRGRQARLLWGDCARSAGCTSAAATTDEVLRRATEGVRLWAEDALADGEKLPKPRSVEALRTDPEVVAALAEGAALAIVPLVLDSGRPVKANLLARRGPARCNR